MNITGIHAFLLACIGITRDRKRIARPNQLSSTEFQGLIASLKKDSTHWVADTSSPSLGHCGLSAASRCKLTFTSRHYALLTLQPTFLSKLILKVLTTTCGVPPAHILTNVIINWLLDANANRKSAILRTVNGEDSQNGLCADLENSGFPTTVSCTKILLTLGMRPAANALNYSIKNIRNDVR